jgi:hypothetical protein
VASLPTGAVLTYTLSGNVMGSPAQIVNTAFVELPVDTTVEDPQLANNSATDTDLLDDLFRNGFENPALKAASGSLQMPSVALQAVLGTVAIALLPLDDADGAALRVYARLYDGQLQFALARRDSSGALRLAEWHSYSGDPTLSWSARPVGDGWVLEGAELR